MRNTQGGTRKWCSNCKAERFVEASKPSWLGDSSQRWHVKEHEDIHFFRIYLDLRVKIAKNWQRDPKQLGRLGF